MRDIIKETNAVQPHIDMPLGSSVSKSNKKRVAAYARVSTDSDEQLSSYEAQVDFYARHIISHSEWELVDVYTDEGISGTNTKKRDGFNRMIADALDGKIDLILTKSISRFARNTVDSLVNVRKLREKGVEVYFEKENIHTLDAKGEVLITIMGSLAQEESRSISENVSWGKKKSMADGKIVLPYKNFLGYEKGENGLPHIVEAEAEIVRQIYRLFLDGQTIRNIVQYLTSQGVPTPSGKKQWHVRTIVSILTNEKYKGDARLQKTYTADFLSKRIEQNSGKLQQYYIENSHPAIIDQETFDLVQSEIKQRQPNRRQLNNSSPFAAKLICGECGGYYGSKVWHSNTKYRTKIWRCNKKYDNGQVCPTPNLRDDEVKIAFIQAINQILGNKEQYITQIEQQLPLLADTTELEKDLKKLQAGHNTLMDQMQRCTDENKRGIQDQQKYIDRYHAIDDELKKLTPQMNKLKDEILEKTARKEKIRRFLNELRQMGGLITEFNENLWNATIELVTVLSDKTLSFRFKDDTLISIKSAATNNA